MTRIHRIILILITMACSVFFISSCLASNLEDRQICYGSMSDEDEAWYDNLPEEAQKEIEIQRRNICTKLAQKGDDEAQLMLFFFYKDSDNSNDRAKAKKWVEKAAAQGNPEAISGMGLVYRDGIGVKKNEAKAKYYYKKACNKGFKQACSWINND